jgi:predicted nucleic acid-binding protein
LNDYLLDTNIVSEVRKPKPNRALIEWLQRADPKTIYISVVTLGELQHGVEITRTQDPAKASEIEKWIDGLAATMQILPLDGACLREWARLMLGKPITLTNDCLIAATARVHDLTVVTRNTRDFESFGLRLVNPFEAHI